ncbi:transmembrane protein, putative (macronuclear) [Tetrahymena thermophila SB210]|uniref:Transmembrane protein, putative n=1 Tax=Tetrahymena thermophila (strain SB210) TaxID=312017 RepID=W7X7Y8_TETTS|nr:transmembrane protein, putative [Tetrahymena thermophila SB210]EWS75500.1 transmembrane protein, putative [Tetrahymena thermophila SB210]|eukprot:XP_012651969.1 transmembrane protein, putative [Tetrahymena thermophila SB210]
MLFNISSISFLLYMQSSLLSKQGFLLLFSLFLVSLFFIYYCMSLKTKLLYSLFLSNIFLTNYLNSSAFKGEKSLLMTSYLQIKFSIAEESDLASSSYFFKLRFYQNNLF